MRPVASASDSSYSMFYPHARCTHNMARQQAAHYIVGQCIVKCGIRHRGNRHMPVVCIQGNTLAVARPA